MPLQSSQTHIQNRKQDALALSDTLITALSPYVEDRTKFLFKPWSIQIDYVKQVDSYRMLPDFLTIYWHSKIVFQIERNAITKFHYGAWVSILSNATLTREFIENAITSATYEQFRDIEGPI